MNILVFDHFFWQDLDELSLIAEPENEIVRISYLRWHQVARKYFPDNAFDGVANAYNPDLSENWKAYEKWVEQETIWLINAYRPNLFVTPSDSFFYLRPFISSLKRFGVKTFVLQKETTISPMVMEIHSREIGHFVPFMSDFMTVCSERHKQFWINAGANPDLISVTGQPRFDIYRRENSTLSSGADAVTKVLYLSYDDSAYLPSDLGAKYDGSWKQQRQETERVLYDISQTVAVTVKKHPQQSFAEDWIGPNVKMADRFTDTRTLIVDADVVVGFQTTALYESAVAGKPTIYAAWGDIFEKNKESLIRFDLASDLVIHAASPTHLRNLLSQKPKDIPRASEAALRLVYDELGPIDGKATERSWSLMKKHFSTPNIEDISSSLFFVGLKYTLYSRTYGLFVLISKLVLSSKTDGLKRRQDIAHQILNERRRIFRHLKEVSAK